MFLTCIGAHVPPRGVGISPASGCLRSVPRIRPSPSPVFASVLAKYFGTVARLSDVCCSDTRRQRTGRGQRHAMRARMSVVGAGLFPPRRLTAAETEGYTTAKIRGGCAIQTIGMPGGRSLLLAGVVVALSSHGCRVAARGAAAVGDATRGANCRHASRETPAAGIDVGRGTLRDGLGGRPPGGDPLAVATSAKFCGRDNTSRTRGQSDQRIESQKQSNLNQESSI